MEGESGMMVWRERVGYGGRLEVKKKWPRK